MKKGTNQDPVDRAVRVAFRLSRDELACIAPSIQMVAACYRAAEADGGVPDKFFLQVFRPKELDATRFDQPLLKMLLSQADWMRARLSGPYSSYRLHCHVLELAAMSFSIRLIKRQHRHGHLRGAFRFPGPRLLRKLENLRRRAARLAKKASGDAIYAELQLRWHGLERWIAFCLFHCDCNRPSVYPIFRSRRRYVTIGVNIAASAIRDQLNRTPSQAELHRLVRRAFRYARLGRIAFSIRDLVSDIFPTREEYVYLYRIWAAEIADLTNKEAGDEEIVDSDGVRHEQGGAA
jgi:hypothetical protein